MKLEVGMYVRTKWGIDKIKDIVLNGNFYEDSGLYLEKNGKLICGKKGMKELKASHNLIDLIEEGDILKYVYDNKECVSKVLDRGSKMLLVTAHLEVSLGLVDIKSIVTKEIFSSISYEVSK